MEDVAQHQVVVVDAEHGVFDEKGCVHVFKVGFAAVVHSFREERNEGQAFQIAEFRFLGKVIGVVPVDDEQGTRLKKFFQFAVIGKNRNSGEAEVHLGAFHVVNHFVGQGAPDADVDVGVPLPESGDDPDNLCGKGQIAGKRDRPLQFSAQRSDL